MGNVLIIKDADFSAVAVDKISTQVVITVNSSSVVAGAATGSGTYNTGDEVTLVASPNAGYVFKQWSDGNTNATRTITAGICPTTYIAIFVKKGEKIIFYSSIDGTNYDDNFVNYNLPFYTNRNIYSTIVGNTVNYVKLKLSSVAQNYIGHYVSVKKCNNTPILSIISSKELTQEDVNNGYIEIYFNDTTIEDGYYIGVGDRDKNTDPTGLSEDGFAGYNSTQSNMYIIGNGFIFKEFSGQIGIEIGRIL